MWGSIFGLASSTINAIRVAKVGTEFGKLGKLTTYRNTKISSYTKHGLERLNQRGISESTLKSIIKNGKVLVQTAGDGGKKYLYVAKKGLLLLHQLEKS